MYVQCGRYTSIHDRLETRIRSCRRDLPLWLSIIYTCFLPVPPRFRKEHYIICISCGNISPSRSIYMSDFTRPRVWVWEGVCVFTVIEDQSQCASTLHYALFKGAVPRVLDDCLIQRPRTKSIVELKHPRCLL